MELSEWLGARGITEQTALDFSLREVSRQKRPAAVYPSPCGVERVRFLDEIKPKYKWARAGGVPCWYGLVEASAKPGPIWIVNGEPSVWHAHQYGVAAVCTLGGESRIPSDRTLQELGAKGRQIRILFDDDVAGREGGQKLAQAFKANGITVEIRGWKEARENLELPPKCDVDDLARVVKDQLAETLSNFEIIAQEPVEKPMPRGGSHWHLAEIVLQRLTLRGSPPPVHTRGGWWRYLPSRGFWEQLDEYAIALEIGALDGAQIGFGETPKYLAITAGLIASVTQCAVAQAYVDTFFDNAKSGVCFTDGFFSAKGFKMEPHSPDNRQTYSVDVPYTPGAKHNVFDIALMNWFGRTDADECKLIQEFIGATLFGITGKSLWLIGDGENGKSQLLDIMAGLVPSHARVSISPQKLADQRAEYYVAQLARARLNVDADIPAREMVDSAEWKKSVTGDELTGRDPAGRPFNFKPKVLHIFSANDLPSTRDHSHGFWRRIIPLRIARKAGEFVEIPDLAKKVLSEELASIVAWGIEGARRLLAQGYTLPDSSEKEKDEWKHDSDQVARFIHEACDTDVDNWSEAMRVYQWYCDWAAKTGSGKLSMQAFGRRAGRYVEKRAVRTGTEYRMLRASDLPF